jgi:hypothetical protein
MKTFLFVAVVTTAFVTTSSAEKISIALKSGGSMTGTLVGKSATEIKIETDFGIIPLQVGAVTSESWTAAQRAATSKPSGKYIVPTPSPKPPQFGKQIENRGAGISVAEIERAYAENPVAADLRFRNKPISVTGVIDKIGTSEWGRPFVQIGEKVIKHYPSGVQKKVAHLKVGQTTTLTGICYGISGESGLIIIREATSYQRDPQR